MGKETLQLLSISILHFVYWHFYIIELSKVGDRSRRLHEGFLFNSYNTKVYGRVLLLSLHCSTIPLIRTLYCWVLSKAISSTIFKVFGMMWPGIEHWSPGPLANTLRTWHTSSDFLVFHISCGYFVEAWAFLLLICCVIWTWISS